MRYFDFSPKNFSSFRVDAGTWQVSSAGKWYFHSGRLFAAADGRPLATTPATVCDGQALYGIEAGQLVAQALELREIKPPPAPHEKAPLPAKDAASAKPAETPNKSSTNEKHRDRAGLLTPKFGGVSRPRRNPQPQVSRSQGDLRSAEWLGRRPATTARSETGHNGQPTKKSPSLKSTAHAEEKPGTPLPLPSEVKTSWRAALPRDVPQRLFLKAGSQYIVAGSGTVAALAVSGSPCARSCGSSRSRANRGRCSLPAAD